MFSTGIFTVSQYNIKVDNLDLPIYLLPFGDVHRDSPLCDIDKWHEFLQWAKKKERAYFLGMGDYNDSVSGTERLILNNEALHEATKQSIINTFEASNQQFIKEIDFMKDRLIGFIEGNHYGWYADNMTTTQKMANELSAKYLGVSCFIRLMFTFKKETAYLDIWAHHGKGAARLVGGSLNRVQQMAEAAEADIYLMGHDHKKSSGTASKLRLLTNKDTVELHHRKQLYLRTGSFLKGYEHGQASYIADSAMNPTDIGVVKVELTPRRNKEGIFYVDIHASI